MEIGERLKQCRLALGYSAEFVADKIGISPATMYRYENGDIAKMPAKLLDPLSRVLSTSPGYLMGWSNDSPPVIPISLSADESVLVSDYRLLSPDGKTYIRQTMAMAVQTYGKNHPVSGLADQA